MKKASIASVNVAQKEECIGAVSTAARKGAALAFEDLEKTDSLGDPETFQKEIIERQGELSALVRESVREMVRRKIAEMIQKIVGCLKLISGGEVIEIPETDGNETLAQARDVFTGWVDGDLEGWGTNVPGKPTSKTKAQVFEMEKDGDFKTIFTIPGRDLDSLCWEQSQIKAFAKYHTKWLHPKGWATFLLFKVGEGKNKKFFVADVYRGAGGLGVSVSRLEDGRVWVAECRDRIGLPQLTLES